MSETNEFSNLSIIQQLRKVIKDAIDYLVSVLTLAQARATEVALSSLLFAALLIFASLLGLCALILFMVALGFWLTHITGSVIWALLIIGALLSVIAYASVHRALKWLDDMKS